VIALPTKKRLLMGVHIHRYRLRRRKCNVTHPHVFEAGDPEAAIFLRGHEEGARRSLSAAYLNFYSKTF